MNMRFQKPSRPRIIALTHMILASLSLAWCATHIPEKLDLFSLQAVVYGLTLVLLFPLGLPAVGCLVFIARGETWGLADVWRPIWCLAAFFLNSYLWGNLIHWMLRGSQGGYSLLRRAWIWSKIKTGGMVRIEDRTEQDDGQLSSESALSDEVSS